MNQALQSEGLMKLLEASAVFSGIQTDTLNLIIDHAQRLKCNKNEYIQVNSINTDYFYIVGSGSIMLSRVTDNGDNYVIDILKRGGIFGVTNIFNNGNQANRIIAEAVSQCLLWRVPISALQKIIEKDNSFTHNFLCMNLSTRLCQDLELEHRTLQNVSQRIGCFLLSQCAGSIDSPITLKLPYSKHTIAAKLGVRPETFSRALVKLEKETGIQTHGLKVHIPDTNQLKKYICPSCSLNYPCHTNLNKPQIY